ncbi:hypothetical protein Lal_00049912 [Lupinus albus]|nr:hypothetical protein Lal_00049912 [Lupinus albus]
MILPHPSKKIIKNRINFRFQCPYSDCKISVKILNIATFWWLLKSIVAFTLLTPISSFLFISSLTHFMKYTNFGTAS